jgi:imidazolonepropionase
MNRLLIHNIGLLATPTGSAAKAGPAQGQILLQNNAWILAEDGLIKQTGTGDSWQQIPQEDLSLIDAGGKLVTPGLVDAHTHLIFGGWRQNELGLKLHGATYLDILAGGGGILSTVRATREATEESLYQKAKEALDEMLTLGITSMEAKSGYGLDRETELKQLRVIRRLGREHCMDVRSTFLGAHALPEDYKDDREGYIRFLCEEMIPEVAAEGLADYCDVFCEKGVFTAEESRVILEAGKKHGLIPKIHADEIEAIGGSELTADVKAISAEHLIVCQPSGIKALAEGGTIACLLPATSFYLGATYAPARDMIEAGVPVAAATDFNPGSCPSLNIQLVMNLACLKYRMTPEEMLTAVTLNAAAAIGLAEKAGSVEPGKQADLVLWNAPDLDYLGYRMGSNLVNTVIKNGNIAHH